MMVMMTIDELAIAIQAEFLDIRSQFAEIRGQIRELREEIAGIKAVMATKQDLADLREEMIARFATHSELQSAVDGLRDELTEEIRKISYAKEIDELRGRMGRVEYELGIGPGSAAA